MAGFSGTGTALEISDMSGTPVWTEVANVFSITPPGAERTMIDVTAHDSPNGDQEEVSGRKNTTDLTLQLYWDPDDATHQELQDLMDSGSENDFRIVFPVAVTATPWAFSGRVSRFTPGDIGLEAAITATVTIRVQAPLSLP